MSQRHPFTAVALLAGALLVTAPVAATAWTQDMGQQDQMQDEEMMSGSMMGPAVGGYDVVAYFEDGEATEGTAEHSYEFDGGVWQFASAAHRDAFAADPERYLPRYGGHCAYAVSLGATAPGDPEVWKVVDGKLYLNKNREVQGLWERDIPGNIRKADENWPTIEAETMEEHSMMEDGR